VLVTGNPTLGLNTKYRLNWIVSEPLFNDDFDTVLCLSLLNFNVVTSGEIRFVAGEYRTTGVFYSLWAAGMDTGRNK
jgi:hypothetical protein